MSSPSTSRCAACKYLRRRCASNCIFSPYFPSNDPYRFACVHRIYGASNVSKMLQQIPTQMRGQAADAMYFEAQSRIQDPVYGCVGIISRLQQQIRSTESELAKVRAQIAVHNSDAREQSLVHVEREPNGNLFFGNDLFTGYNSSIEQTSMGSSSVLAPP